MTDVALQSGPPDIPDKLYFKIGEVSDLLGVEPYVLRFWETEFPVLQPKKSGTGHRLYRRKDVELLLRIKQSALRKAVYHRRRAAVARIGGPPRQGEAIHQRPAGTVRHRPVARNPPPA
jgi:hypothetical protein